MRRVIALVLGITLVLVAALPVLAGGDDVDVTIEDNDYSPETTKFISTYGYVTWTNDGVNTHTATSDEGFWDSGTLLGSGGRGLTSMYTTTLYGAGTYLYHCQIHGASMAGKIRVPTVASTDAVFAGSTIQVTYGSSLTKGITWDVQRRVNGGEWKLIREGVGNASTNVTPKKLGYVEYRARTNDGPHQSGWSKKARVEVVEGPG